MPTDSRLKAARLLHCFTSRVDYSKFLSQSIIIQKFFEEIQFVADYFCYARLYKLNYL